MYLSIIYVSVIHDRHVLSIYPSSMIPPRDAPHLDSGKSLLFRTQVTCTGVTAVVQLLSRVWLFAFPWTAARQASLFFTISRNLLTITSVESVMPSNHLVLYCPLVLMPSIFPSIRVFSYELALWIRRSKYWSFSFSISPSDEHLGLISFRIDWLNLLVVQGTLKSLLQVRRH